MKKGLVYLYIVILAILAGIILSSQVLSFASIYRPAILVISNIVFIGLFGFLLHRYAFHFLYKMIENDEKTHIPKWMGTFAFIISIVFLVVVLLFPLFLWPYSGINHELTWDAGVYHFPKATTMILSHSSWDLSISYGEYPFGYESLIAASLLVNQGGYLIGIIHALILLFFILTLFFLTNRFSKLPAEYLLFLVIMITASFDLFPWFDSNPFSMLRILAFIIGKNDFILASLLLSFILFAPIGKSDQDFSMVGLSITGALVACTKPNGFLILAGIWIIVLLKWIRNWNLNRKCSKKDWGQWAGVILINLIGLLWVLRNYLVQGRLFSENSLLLSNQSILMNIGSPAFINSIDLNFKIALVIFIVVTILSLIKKVNWVVPYVFVLMIITFLMTPASFVFEAGDSKGFYNWRFGAYLLAFLIPMIFLLVEIPLKRWLKPGNKISRVTNSFALIGMLVICFLGWAQTNDRLKTNSDNAIVLKDQYLSPVGVDGYYSAYDYVQKNISNSTIWVENGMPYYVAGNPITNSVTRLKPPDYLVLFQTNWSGSSESIEYPSLSKIDWQLVYADPEGMVYKRIK